MNGNILWDSISNLNLSLTEGSVLTGAVLDDESCAGEGGSGSCRLTIGEGSSWIVTGDSTVTELTCIGTVSDADGNTVSIVRDDGTVLVQGNSSFTVTVQHYIVT